MNSSVRENTYTAIGVMSGTSLDGLDIAACTFKHQNGQWSFEIHHAITYTYDNYWREHLKIIHDLDAPGLIMHHHLYGQFIGNKVLEFINETGFRPQIIASHGHTVFHDPSNGYTFQIGSGADIAAKTGITTVCDFRSTDVALGGQGAPLVPIGDRLLFHQYQACINLGGFSNISFEHNDQRVAFDICPANIMLNMITRSTGNEFDHNGEMAARGNLLPHLLQSLNQLEYYQQTPPKSLGREWVEKHMLPLFYPIDQQADNKLRTMTEHIALQIASITASHHIHTVLVSGGGSHNGFLIQRIRALSKATFIIPDKLTIDFKEALVFAFLGVLRILHQTNCLASVTGAGRDSSTGAIYLPAADRSDI